MRPGAFKALLAVTGIFIAGGVVGGVAGVSWERHEARVVSDRAFTDKQLKRLIGSLELTAEQVDCMRPVMREFAERIRVARRNAFFEVGHVWREINAQIERELSPHQLAKFREIQAQDLERWEREQERRCAPHQSSAKAPAAQVGDEAIPAVGVDSLDLRLPPQ